MSKRRVVLALLAAVSIAAAGAVTVPAGATTEEIVLKDCDEQYAAFTMPASEAEPYMPDGFHHTGIGGPVPEGRATFITVITECDGPKKNESAGQLWGALLVQPPSEYQADGSLLYYINVVSLTTSETIAKAYREWNVPRFCVGDIDLNADINFDVSEWESELSTRDEDCTFEPGTEDGVGLKTTVPASHPDNLATGAIRIFGVEPGDESGEGPSVTGIVDVTGTGDWKGANGGVGVLDNGGLIPFDVDWYGSAGHAWDFGERLTPAPLP